MQQIIEDVLITHSLKETLIMVVNIDVKKSKHVKEMLEPANTEVMSRETLN